MTDPKNIKFFIEFKLAPILIIIGVGILDFYTYQVFINKHFKSYLFLDFFQGENYAEKCVWLTTLFGLFAFAIGWTIFAIIMLMFLFGLEEEHDVF